MDLQLTTKAQEALSTAVRDAAAAGQFGARTLLTVVGPQLRPALLGGVLLVGLHLLAEFGALQLLRFPTFTTAIYDQYGHRGLQSQGQGFKPRTRLPCPGRAAGPNTSRGSLLQEPAGALQGSSPFPPPRTVLARCLPEPQTMQTARATSSAVPRDPICNGHNGFPLRFS